MVQLLRAPHSESRRAIRGRRPSWWPRPADLAAMVGLPDRSSATVAVDQPDANRPDAEREATVLAARLSVLLKSC